MDRRQFGLGMAACTASTLLRGGTALTQTTSASTATGNTWGTLGGLSARARRLGLTVPRMSAGLTGGTGFADVMPAVVDFIDHIKASAKGSSVAQSDIDALIKDASDLLSGINSAERSPRSEGEGPAMGVQLTTYSFEELRDDYTQLFDTCTISDAHRAQVTWYVNKLTDPDYDEKYDTVEDVICIPWYFVGIIHAMEASFNFDAHLHNGDPLDHKTVHVPAGRPPVWLPPSDWPSSAEDALTLEGYANQTDWSLARMLYRFEAYNGFGTRRHGVNTPYLWAFSNHYTKGKYVADGQWDANAVSSQCGAAVMLKALLTSGKIAQPS